MKTANAFQDLFKAVRYLIADPEELVRSTKFLFDRLRASRPGLSNEEVRAVAAERIISEASTLCGLAGAVTSLPSVVPGIGTAVAILGGGIADGAASLKFQVEMTMKLGSLYGHEIRSTKVQLLCFLIAALGAGTDTAVQGGIAAGSKTLQRLLREKLKGGLLKAVKAAFSKVGLTFTRSSVSRAIPGFVGVALGFGANKLATRLAGAKVRDLFSSDFMQAEFAMEF